MVNSDYSKLPKETLLSIFHFVGFDDLIHLIHFTFCGLFDLFSSEERATHEKMMGPHSFHMSLDFP